MIAFINLYSLINLRKISSLLIYIKLPLYRLRTKYYLQIMVKINNISSFFVLFLTMLSCSKTLNLHNHNMIPNSNKNVIPNYNCIIPNHNQNGTLNCNQNMIPNYNQNLIQNLGYDELVYLNQSIIQICNLNLSCIDKNYNLALSCIDKYVKNKGSRIILKRKIRKYKKSFFENRMKAVTDFYEEASSKIGYPRVEDNKMYSYLIITGFIRELKIDNFIEKSLFEIIYNYARYYNGSIHMLYLTDVRSLRRLLNCIYSYAPIICKWKEGIWEELSKEEIYNFKLGSGYQKIIDKRDFPVTVWELACKKFSVRADGDYHAYNNDASKMIILKYEMLLDGFIRENYGKVTKELNTIKDDIFKHYWMMASNRTYPNDDLNHPMTSTTFNCNCVLYSSNNYRKYIIAIDHDPTYSIVIGSDLGLSAHGHNSKEFVSGLVSYQLFQNEYPSIQNPFKKYQIRPRVCRKLYNGPVISNGAEIYDFENQKLGYEDEPKYMLETRYVFLEKPYFYVNNDDTREFWAEKIEIISYELNNLFDFHHLHRHRELYDDIKDKNLENIKNTIRGNKINKYFAAFDFLEDEVTNTIARILKNSLF